MVHVVVVVESGAQAGHVGIVAEKDAVYLAYHFVADLGVEEAVDERDGETLKRAANDLEVETNELELDGQLATHKRLPYAKGNVVYTKEGQQDQCRFG